MNRSVAYSLLSDELEVYRAIPFKALVDVVGNESLILRRGMDGIDYSISLCVRWSDNSRRDLRVSGSVSPADWNAPHDRLDESFVVRRATRD